MKACGNLFQEVQLARNIPASFGPPFSINDDQTGKYDEDYAGEKVVKKGASGKKQPSKREGNRNAKIFKRRESWDQPYGRQLPDT